MNTIPIHSSMSRRCVCFIFMLLLTIPLYGCRQPLEQTAPTKGGQEAAAAQRLVDSNALQELLQAADASHSNAVVILKDGQLVGAWHAGGKVKKIEAMSATKSIVNLAIGRLITLGLIESLDQPVYEFYPQWQQGDKANVTLRHLLNHTSGLQANVTTEAIYASPDFVGFALDSELANEPGSRFFYNNKAVNLLAGIVEKASGQPMDEFLRGDLFKELGITDFDWTRDKAGNPHGMSGLQIYPQDLAKIGQFTLDRGLYNDKQLIDVSWFDVSLAPGSDLNPYCGLLWWLTPEILAYTIDDAHIATLQEAGVSEAFLSTVKQHLKGRYETSDDYTAALEKTFGPDYQDILNRELEPIQSEPLGLSKKEFGPLTYYSAQGYLGQYLVVYPQERLVGVRLFAESFLSGDPKPEHSFGDFPQMLSNLVE